MIKDTNKVGKLKLVKSQKSMDDDNPTIPVNRGVAGVYIPEPNEEERAKKDMMNSISKYLRISKHDMLVENVTVDKKCYCVSITYEYQSGEITHNPKETR